MKVLTGWADVGAGPMTQGSSLTAVASEMLFWHQAIKVAMVLAALLGLLMLGLYVWRRLGMAQPGKSTLIQVVATHYLAPKQALILLAVGPERLLLARCGDQLSLLKTLESYGKPPDCHDVTAGRSDCPADKDGPC